MNWLMTKEKKKKGKNKHLVPIKKKLEFYETILNFQTFTRKCLNQCFSVQLSETITILFKEILAVKLRLDFFCHVT